MNARGAALNAQSAWLVFDDHPVRAVLDFESGIASCEEVPSLLRLYPAAKRAVAQLAIRFTDGADVVPPIGPHRPLFSGCMRSTGCRGSNATAGLAGWPPPAGCMAAILRIRPLPKAARFTACSSNGCRRRHTGIKDSRG